MTKRYAPPVPHPSYHRKDDELYFHELMKAAGLSQTKTAPYFSRAPRSVRRRVKIGEGRISLSYPEQYLLEVLADVEQRQQGALEVGESPPTYGEPPRTQWFNVEARRLTAADAGKMLVGKDKFGAPIHGTLTADGFGLVIKSIEGLDVHNVPVDRVAVYTLLDPPPADGQVE